MPHNDNVSGFGAWARRHWRALVSEVISTALLVLLGVASLCPGGGQAALTFGFVVAALVAAFGPVSGAHMNPAVSLAALVYGQMDAPLAAAYSVAQLVGGVVGFGALKGLAPHEFPGQGGCALPSPAMGLGAAAAVEALLTAVLALVCCALWAAHDPARPDHGAPVKLGITVAALVLAGGHLSGAGLNPARALGPAVVQNSWRAHWVYWVGPLLGAAAAAALCRWALLPPPPRAARASPARVADVEMPLTDKADR